jgi:phosphoribosylglycinamide formyltransferase 2
MEMSETALNKAKDIAKKIVEGLGGRGIFGVELFVKGDEVYFSEVSPRPHDTGLVTLITQSQSEFALHIRAVLNLPLGFEFITPGASAAFKADRDSYNPTFEIDPSVFNINSRFVVFGKPESHPGRRMGVLLVSDKEAKEALKQAKLLIQKVKIS